MSLQKGNGNSQFYYLIAVSLACGAYIVKFAFNKEPTPIIETAAGRIQGSIAYSREGREYLQFRGIPYAKPPVGELRFQSPLPADNWTDVLQATEFGPICIGVEFLTSGRLLGQEDCLYLNVFVPNIKRHADGIKAPLLPVMVFIHGGGFTTGSASAYGEQYFMDEDIILVSMNYRLGIFGFLNAEDEAARGNMGLKDQSLALRWVRENIESFGGDPGKVTLFGESAGGASVHFHMLSPMSRGLFDKAISMSGNAMNPFWLMNRSYSEQVEMLSKRFKCPVTPRREFVRCLQNVDAGKLGVIHHSIQSPIHPPRDAFSPSVEAIVDNDAFLTEQPYKLLQSGQFHKIPWMVGANEDEGLIFVARVLYNESLSEAIDDPEVWNRYMPIILYYDEANRNASDTLREHYVGDLQEFSPLEFSPSLARMFSDRLFFQSMHLTASMHLEHSKLYLYHYTYRGSFNVFNVLRYISPYSKLPIEVHAIISFIKHWILRVFFDIPYPEHGPCHGDEMLMLFNISPFLDVSKANEEDYQMSKLMVKTWTGFAKQESSLKVGDISWTPVDRNGPMKYLQLDSTSTVMTDPFSARIQLWEDLKIL